MKNYIRCKRCGCRINLDTGYKYTPCSCRTIAVIGGSDCYAIISHFKDYEFIEESKDDGTYSGYVYYRGE